MIKSEKKLENARIEIEIEVPENRVEKEYKTAFNRIQRNAKIDGFRKGKVPMNIIETRFIEMADKEVAENLLRSMYIDAVTEKNYQPVNTPEFDFQNISRGNPFEFKAVFEVMPSQEIGKYKGLTVKERTCKITDDDIKRDLENLQERNATIAKKEENNYVEKGNLVKIKLKRLDNLTPEEIEKADYKEYSILVGKSKDEPNFDKDLIGMKLDEEKEIKIKYPKDYAIKDLAGQTATYHVKIAEINTMTLPVLDDEFAKDMGEYESLQQLKDEIRNNLEKYVNEKARAETKNKLIKEIINGSTYDIPSSMVQKEMSAIFQKVQERTGYFTQDINQFTSTLGLNNEEFTAKLRTEALEHIKTTLALSEIAKTDGLRVPEEKFQEVIEAIAKRNSKPVDEIQNIINDNNSREKIESELLLDVALDFVYDNADIKKEKPLSLQEFLKEN